jgi:hypothetical protein
VPGYCTIVPRNLSVIFHRWNGFQWAISEGRDYDAPEYHGCIVTYT